MLFQRQLLLQYSLTMSCTPDVPVWSKLETGRIPSPQEMFQIIDNHMRLSSQTHG